MAEEKVGEDQYTGSHEFWENKKRWLIPVISVLAGIGGLYGLLRITGMDIGSMKTSIDFLKSDVKDLKNDVKPIPGIVGDIEEIKTNTNSIPGMIVKLGRAEVDIKKQIYDFEEFKSKVFPGTGYGEEVGPVSSKPKTYKGRIGIIKQENGSPIAAGGKYNGNELVASKNMNGPIKNARWGQEYSVYLTEYSKTKHVTVKIVDKFNSSPDVILDISPRAAEVGGMPLEKGMTRAEVTEKKW